VDGDDIRGERGVDTEVRDGQTVRVVAAVAGG
jgi:sulfur carrier protein ThiS